MTTSRPSKKITCDVCGKAFSRFEVHAGSTLRPALQPYVEKHAPAWNAEQNICLSCLNKVRSDFVENSLLSEKGELTAAEIEVLESLRNQESISTRPTPQISDHATLGDRLADQIAAIGGSWGFISGFGLVLVGWIAINSWGLRQSAFDPFPYILLNLMLSCLAAIQAPVIMMSQNRQAAKDRKQAEADYKTNLKAELEIRHLHIKIDQLISQQWHKLLEIQQVQLDMMRESMNKQTHDR